MTYAKLLLKIEEHVTSFFVAHATPALTYHNYFRATEVVTTAAKIAKYYSLDQRQKFIVAAAAWFHDTGFLEGSSGPYEVRSAELAATFLRSLGVTETDATEIKMCILATADPEKASTLSEKIVCDADTFYLGTARFKESRRLLKKEIEALKKIKIEPHAWLEETITMLEKHKYYTDYCKSLLGKTKDELLIKLKSKQSGKFLQKATMDISLNPINENEVDHEAETRPGKVQVAEKKPIRGVETMFRISSSNSQKISEMADNKAHIMISVNSIIISVVLGLIVGKLDENKKLIIPTIILLAINVITIIYSVLATRPKVHNGTFSSDQLDNKSVNLLFYGSFYNMEFKEYDNGMRRMMEDREFLYGSLIKDIYWQGKVLGRKYKFLHMSYNIFMYGIAISVLAFTIAACFFD